MNNNFEHGINHLIAHELARIKTKTVSVSVNDGQITGCVYGISEIVYTAAESLVIRFHFLLRTCLAFLVAKIN